MNKEQQHAHMDDILKLQGVREEIIDLGDASSLAIPINNSTCRLYRVSCLTYEKDFPRQEAFENVVASINNVHCRLVYYLRGVDGGVEFYIGVVNMGIDDSLNIGDYGNMLSRAFKGNFLGSQLQELKEQEAKELLSGLRKPSMEFSTLLGVPTRNSQREDISFQGVDRLVNIMTSGGRSLGQSFHLLIVWEPVDPEGVAKFEASAKTLYSVLSAGAKQTLNRTDGTSEQHGSNWQDSQSVGKNEGESHTTNQSDNWGNTTQNSKTFGKNEGKSHTVSDGTSWNNNRGGSSSSSSRGGSKGASDTQSGGTSESASHSEGSSMGGSKGRSDTQSSSNSETNSHSEGRSESMTQSHSDSESWEVQNKFVQDAMEHIKDELQPRIRRGKAKGMYKTAVYVGAETPLNRALLENALISICQGDKPTFTTMYARPLPRDEAAYTLVSSLNIRDHLKTDASLLLLDSRPVVRDTVSLATWLTAAEISMLAGMPQKEVPGLELREQVAFGLNIGRPNSDDQLELGHMMQEGSHLEARRVCLDRRELSKHVFIAGTTGSGKTTTCHKLLASSAASRKALPFLVVEPAKTEYRALLRDPLFADAVIFTVGNEEGVPFRFNPFEFLPEESLSGHVDLLKACFMASFDMEAAIPNLLEEGLYRVYEVYGWNFRNNSNKYLENREDAWKAGGQFFPTISSYIKIILKLVDEKGFDERLRDEYKGSIRARLDSLRAGAKGLMLDTPLSVDFMELIDKQVILELEGLKSGEDKAFLMGLVLGRMIEALKIRHSKDVSFRHITLVEEAHRLLTRPMSGDSPNRKLGVETFTDLLAEVRKYGESLIIVDQIPSKLAPEVLKNTNTKIIHKLFARDDKDAVGDTMALDDKQKSYLSYLAPGEAVIFSQGWKKPVDMQVEQLSGIATDNEDIPQEMVNEIGWKYWLQHPELFCPGLLRDTCTNMTREKLTEVVSLRESFWEALMKKQNWREPLRTLIDMLGEMTNDILLTQFSAWEMMIPDNDTAARKNKFLRLPSFIKLFLNAGENDDKYFATEVVQRTFSLS